MTSETARSTADALVLLEVPPYDELSEEQRRGARCVWTNMPLTAETAIDLGERADDDGVPWWPRAWRSGMHDVAVATLRAHAGCCEMCAIDANLCETATALSGLTREYPR
ncbi:hypothetical protein EDD90_3324 [Streptomyces sp. Ag109_O5-1]|uniref:hypothetical protein n=1 Tax=Streptomyces sp. Ag109_O5-1 TaxID=1938851 RepID=UPI000F4D94C9|nr:hypothetical protein [Streptomyces sp. Ag109_O5-1]RPE40288.1 hypothetical protein EDD90_3324 [Streptomyces sp. Ag109_O5-1]